MTHLLATTLLASMQPLATLLVLIPALPLIAAIATAALGPRVLGRQSHWPTVLAIGGSCVLSLTLLAQVYHEAEESPLTSGWETTIDLWNWVAIDGAIATPANALPIKADAGATQALPERLPLAIDVTLRADPLTAIMLAMVTFVSTLVAIYASGYMHGDRGYWRFFTYISLFVFSMTMLVSVSNFLLIYVFWEAVGACSYLLIGFWYEKPEAVAAGKKAFLVNRVGDVGFALAIFLIWTTYGTLQFHDGHGIAGVLGQARLAAPGQFVGGAVGAAIALLLFWAACGKSAQFPLHVWLPDAMEGPTPVSALIHAATMVTAGVYLVARCTPLFFAAPEARDVVAIIGTVTALMAAFIAFTQTDLKRVLAYSTISQLGYMFVGLGCGTLAGINAGMLHLFTHAFFKALLFLGAGSVMHAMGGVIDMRRFGGLRRLMPVTHWTFLIGCLALAGVPVFAGFWSKDAIVSALYTKTEVGHAALAQPLHTALFFIILGTSLMTAIYTFRAYFLTFHGEERIPSEAGHHAHESPRSMTIPLILLSFGAAFAGFLELNDVFADFLGRTPSLAFQDFVRAQPEEMFHPQIVAISIVLALSGVGLAAYLYLGDARVVDWLTGWLRPLYVMSYGKLFIDQIYQLVFVWPAWLLAQLCYWLDRWLIDGLVNLVGRVPPAIGACLRPLQRGLVPFYALAMILGALVLIGTILFAAG